MKIEENQDHENQKFDELQTLLQIRRARETLLASLEEQKLRHRAKIRALDSCENKLFDQIDDPNAELIPKETVLSPEILQIIQNPLSGL